MRFWVICLLIGISVQTLKAQHGTYSTRGFEWSSTLKLNKDGTFEYFYGISGCQGNVTGKYELTKNNKIRFIPDEEYTDDYQEKQLEKNKKEWEDFNKANELNIPFTDLRPCYPNLNEGNWKFTNKGIKSKSHIDCACISTKNLLHNKSYKPQA